MTKIVLKLIPVVFIVLISTQAKALDATSVALLRNWCTDVDNASSDADRTGAWWCLGYVQSVADRLYIDGEICTGAHQIDVVTLISRTALSTASDGAYAAEVVSEELRQRFPCP